MAPFIEFALILFAAAGLKAVAAAFEWLKNRDTEREQTKRYELAQSKVPVGAVYATSSHTGEVFVLDPCPTKPKPVAAVLPKKRRRRAKTAKAVE